VTFKAIDNKKNNNLIIIIVGQGGKDSAFHASGLLDLTTVRSRTRARVEMLPALGVACERAHICARTRRAWRVNASTGPRDTPTGDFRYNEVLACPKKKLKREICGIEMKCFYGAWSVPVRAFVLA
jgi:hypothetical protein